MQDNLNSNKSQTRLVDIILPLEQSEDQDAWQKAISKELEIEAKDIYELRLKKHSIDARQRQIKVQLRIEVGIKNRLPPVQAYNINYHSLTADAKRVIIIGSGPAVMFAALRCIELGCKPIVLERGKNASRRRFDLRPILKEGRVIEDSNYCYGEGGAGTFSDGKLYTRATKRGPVRDVYETLVAHGAPKRILIDAHPHIGSNLLPKVVMAIRQSILEAGGVVHFGEKVIHFKYCDHKKQL